MARVTNHGSRDLLDEPLAHARGDHGVELGEADRLDDSSDDHALVLLLVGLRASPIDVAHGAVHLIGIDMEPKIYHYIPLHTVTYLVEILLERARERGRLDGHHLHG